MGTLIGRIGDGDWFVIGEFTDFTAESSGDLVLVMNDRACCYSDNSESITGMVRVEPGTP
jgi:hypothetical protein